MLKGEVAAMKRLDHSFVINLHFAFDDPKKCYLVMDLKTGGDLRYYLKKRYLFEEVDVAFYVACISSALEHIHSQGVIHRDVKPENILLDERGYPYLTDFGVAHVQEEGSRCLVSTLASGTRQYLAPEVFTKTHIHGPEMDFWSLGVVAYELLFGRRPFEKHCPIAMINYLERALAAKRKFTRELHARQLSSRSMDADSPVLRERSIEASHELPFAPASNYEVGSPPRSLHSSASTRPNSEATTGERGSLAFCSSVSYSRPSNYESLSEVDKQYDDDKAMGTVSQSSDGRQSFGGRSSPGFEDAEIIVVPSIREKPFPSPKHSSKSVLARAKLPSLKAASLTGSPRQMLQSPPPSVGSVPTPSPFPIPENAFEKMGMLPASWCSSRSHFNDNITLESCSDEESSSMPLSSQKQYSPGNHWLVDDGRLCSQLRVSVPKINPWLGELTDDGIDVLKGLFDIRPSCRLGARNIGMLRAHNWFRRFNLNWSSLLERSHRPNFQPGKRFVKDAMEAMGNSMYGHCLGQPDQLVQSDYDAGVPQFEAFEDFSYIASRHKELFKQSQRG